MNRRQIINIAIVLMTLCFLTGTAFFAIGCGHYHNWWSLLSLILLLVAIYVPAICYNYDEEEVWMLQMHTNWSEDTFRICRDLGWILVLMLMVASYSVPAVVWYNAGILWPGVLWIMAGIMLWWWTYILLLRVFVFRRSG